uniref:Uncharacterized protein n=1 Tax=Oryza glumipatula TaxID=40148 RepID=A0A0D9YD34_9ORYZ
MEFSVEAAVEASALSVMGLVSENFLDPSTCVPPRASDDSSFESPDASFDPEDPTCELSSSTSADRISVLPIVLRVLPDRLGRCCPAGGVEGPTSSPAAFLLGPARSSGILPPAGVHGAK